MIASKQQRADNPYAESVKEFHTHREREQRQKLVSSPPTPLHCPTAHAAPACISQEDMEAKLRGAQRARDRHELETRERARAGEVISMDFGDSTSRAPRDLERRLSFEKPKLTAQDMQMQMLRADTQREMILQACEPHPSPPSRLPPPVTRAAAAVTTAGEERTSGRGDRVTAHHPRSQGQCGYDQGGADG